MSTFQDDSKSIDDSESMNYLERKVTPFFLPCFGLVYLTAYQLLLYYLMPKFDLFVNV